MSLEAGGREAQAPRGTLQAASGADILIYVEGIELGGEKNSSHLHPESCIFSWNLCFSLTFTKQAWGVVVGACLQPWCWGNGLHMLPVLCGSYLIYFCPMPIKSEKLFMFC